jgi:radical SAM-linked protein
MYPLQTPDIAVQSTRLRVTFEKTEAMRFTGHLDLHHTWERVFRRAKLPLAYSQGFHPQPRLNLACALPLGFTSQAEVIDAWLEENLPLEQVLEDLNTAVPPGIRLIKLEYVDPRLPSLQTQVLSVDYEMEFLENIPDLESRVQFLLEAEALPRQRNGKNYDLRPLIEGVTVNPTSSNEHMKACICLSAREGATGRPEEFIGALGLDIGSVRVHRVKINFSS